MVKKVIIPEKEIYQLSIPEQYIGKQIEIIVYATDEIADASSAANAPKLSDFEGLLTENDFVALKAYTQQARKQWNRNI